MKIVFVIHLLLSTFLTSNPAGELQPPRSSTAINEASSAAQPEPAVVLSEGVVEMFNSRKGSGFIKPNSSSKLVFVHASDTKISISKNQTVIYEVKKDGKGSRAVNVQLKNP